jgi:hypothetical protein
MAFIKFANPEKSSFLLQLDTAKEFVKDAPAQKAPVPSLQDNYGNIVLMLSCSTLNRV